jgi:cold shock CspA family protein
VTPIDLDFATRWGAREIVPPLCLRCFRQAGPLPKERGTIKWFDRRKRHGFIVSEQGDELFFRKSQLFTKSTKKLHEGQVVRFHVGSALKGAEALNVEVLD